MTKISLLQVRETYILAIQSFLELSSNSCFFGNFYKFWCVVFAMGIGLISDSFARNRQNHPFKVGNAYIHAILLPLELSSNWKFSKDFFQNSAMYLQWKGTWFHGHEITENTPLQVRNEYIFIILLIWRFPVTGDFLNNFFHILQSIGYGNWLDSMFFE